MKPQTLLTLTVLATLLLALALALPAQAHWPTTRAIDLAVAADPTINEGHSSGLPYPNGGTLVTFTCPQGMVYQIIDRYGNLQYPTAQLLIPNQTGSYVDRSETISDSAGGAIVCWQNHNQLPLGFYAQRLDPAGNLLWGDDGVRVYPEDTEWPKYVCPDGDGGFYFAIPFGSGLTSDIRLQHVNPAGQLLLGDSGRVAIAQPSAQDRPILTPDGTGGVYMVWRDYRNGVQIRAERFDAAGHALWTASNGILISSYSYAHKAIADGQGGLLVMKTPGSNYSNTITRVNPRGGIIWIRINLSWGDQAYMIAGEPGYFYVGFEYPQVHGIYAQRVDLQGNRIWPIEPGVMLVVIPGWYGGRGRFAYYDSSLYSVCNMIQDSIVTFRAQIINSQGQCSFSPYGIVLSFLTVYNQAMVDNITIPDRRGGLVGIYTKTDGSSSFSDIFAKHMNAHGTLGGPLPPEEAKTAIKMPVTFEIQGLDVQSAVYVLPQAMQVKLELFNILGARVKMLQDGYLTEGSYTVQIDNRSLPSGVYFLRLQAGDEAVVKKMVMLK